jgi:Mce-associated membrane protein
VAATHAPDTAAITVAQSKIIECSTGDFGVQASLYSSVLVDAYQAANVTVAVSDIRAAVEKHNDDGSFDVLVAVRVQVTNSETADQEQGYRLRLQMMPDAGTFKVARLDQVTSS